MKNVENINELADRRRRYVEAEKENGFEKLRDYLSDQYTEKAHFILELLQNAEDLKASIVNFELYKDKLIFSHNAERQFTLEDVEAITGIGNNDFKQHEIHTIGKYGIGFKAVFRYTKSPIVHSGGLNFKIVDFFIPEPIEPINNNGLTIFEFPFDSEKVSFQESYTEIENGLNGLSDKTTLFLRYIKVINIKIGEHSFSMTSKCDKNSFGIETVVVIKDDIEKAWLRYSKNITIIDDDNNEKELPISVAYPILIEESKIVFDAKSAKERAFVSVFFPLEKEVSNLQFSINGPFITSTSRNSLKTDEEINNNIMNELALLITDSLVALRDSNLIDGDFLRLMPYPEQFSWSSIYRILANKIVSVFAENDFVPCLEGGYVKGRRAASGIQAITDVLSSQDMMDLNLFVSCDRNGGLYYNHNHYQTADRKWIPTYRDAADVNKFLFAIGAIEINRIAFIRGFNDGVKDFETWAFKVGKEKVLDLYLLIEECAEYSKQIDLSDACFLLDKDGKAHKPSDIVYVFPGEKDLKTLSPVFDLYFLTLQDERKSGIVLKLIRDYLRVNKQSYLEDAKERIKKINACKIFDSKYYEDVGELVFIYRYLLDDGVYTLDVVVNSFKDILLLGEDGNLHPIPDLVCDSRYGDQTGQELYNCYKQIGVDVFLLSGNYLECDSIGQNDFIELVNNLPFRRGLKLIHNTNVHSAYCHPLKNKLLDRNGKTSKGERYSNYEVEYQQELMELGNRTISLLIWKLIRSITSEREQFDTCVALYQKNYQLSSKGETDSSFVYYLKNIAWIPNKENVLFKPAEILEEDIAEDFLFDEGNKILIALEFGRALDKNELNMNNALKMISDSGDFLIVRKDDPRASAVQAILDKQQEDKTTKSPMEVLLAENRTAKPVDNSEEFDDEPSGVVNVDKRAEKISEELDEETDSSDNTKITKQQKQTDPAERNILEQWYHGKCQICDTEIKDVNGKNHFVARNIIPTNDLSKEYIEHNELGWNSLCLCPNCALKYRVSTKNIDSIIAISDTDYDFSMDGFHSLKIMLAGEIVSIKFTSKHLQAISVAQKRFKK